MFPLWIASQGSARIGGRAVSSNAGGVQVLAYRQRARALPRHRGGARRMDGSIRGSMRCEKDNTGYDLKDLLHRGRGDARDHHRRDAEAVPASPRGYETALCNVAEPAAGASSCST